MSETPSDRPADPHADSPADPPAGGPLHGIPLHDFLGFEVLDQDESVPYSDVRMPVRPAAFGFTRNLHGGAIATLVDLSCAIAAVRAVGFDASKESLVTADMHLRYVGRPATANVIARSEVVRAGSQLIVIECKVIDEDGHLVCSADLSMMRVSLRRPLD